METKYNLRPLWDALLDIYKTLSDICERHNLRFYVAAGNCLGAVRHKGFIPWDDDMDVFMPWEDYDKFWQYAKEELPEYWKDVGCWNTPEFGEVFGKIQETRKEVLDRVEAQSGLNLGQGIFVDVFPLVNRPYAFWDKVKWNITGFFLKLKGSLVLNGGRRITLKSRLAGIFGWVCWWMYPSLKDLPSAMKIHERRARKFRKCHDGFCGWYSVNKCDLVVPIPTKYFDNAAYLQYESIKVPVPGDYEGYLRYNFGNYMVLPPKDKQKPSHDDTYAPWRLGPTGE